MQPIEIITIIVAVGLVLFPIILKLTKKGCQSSCANCQKKCLVKSLKDINNEIKSEI
jgi:hypothetical protein